MLQGVFSRDGSGFDRKRLIGQLYWRVLIPCSVSSGLQSITDLSDRADETHEFYLPRF